MSESLSKEQIKEIKEQMSGIISVSENSEGYMDTLLKLLSLPDGQFEILAPGVIQSYEQSINNPIDKIALVQAFNANGSKAEDIIESFDTIMESIDKISLSRAKRDFIKQLNQDHKTTVILTTHDMQDIEALTNRILLIGKGRILMDGSPEELKQDAASMDEAVVKLYRSFDEKEGR